MKRVLIAARGEIAVRVARATRELGWIPVTIYTDDDQFSPHVKAGLVSVRVSSYTDIDSIIDAALKVDADIVHPGYGFLSENPDFAAKVLENGMGWAGPSPKAMKLLGDKWSAKHLAVKAGVRTLPWCEARSGEEALKCAEKLGGRVIIKASNAGGGRGLRVAESPKEAARLYSIVAREASVGFGGKAIVYLEKLIDHPRHIEVQILGDNYGHIVHLFERECSVQRRKQKIIEEAPSPYAEKHKDVRQIVLESALRLAEEAEYSNAGTIEFIVNPRTGEAFFIEANTRLQVEHGVTELVTGIDIVKRQLLIADDKRLDINQEDVRLHGWAIEARVYAEDPWNNFIASTGVLKRVRLPESLWVRVDHAVEEGMRINERYDTMIAKIIAYGLTRSEAIERLQKALTETVLSGVETNLDLLRVIVGEEWFQRGEYNTLTLEENLERLLEKVDERRRMASLMAQKLYSNGARRFMVKTVGNGASPLGRVVVSSHGWPWPPTTWKGQQLA